MKKFDFLCSPNFKALRYINENLNKCGIFEVCIFCQGWPLLLLAMGIKQLGYAAVYIAGNVKVCLRFLLRG